MRPSTRIVFALACFLAAPAALFAQASITGVVKDASGAVLPGVTVEASSPELIEKVRTSVTDGTGQYRIVDLRAGVYSVSFALTGFGTVKREGIELTGSFTATVNADLKVGNLAETITVSGETPIVDVQSAKRQATVSGDVIASIPSSRAYGAIFSLNPAVQMGAGAALDIQVMPGLSVFGGAGGRGTEGRVQLDGLNTGAPLSRRRHVGLRARPRERAGGVVHHVGRPRRSGSRRPRHEHRPEDRRQHDQGKRLSRGRDRRHGRQQLLGRPEGARAAHAGRSAEAVGFLGQRRRSDQEGSRLVFLQRARGRQPIARCPACTRTSTPASRASTPTSPI